eukprot:2931199-Pleurochrysis_carterae.AAC.6
MNDVAESALLAFQHDNCVQVSLTARSAVCVAYLLSWRLHRRPGGASRSESRRRSSSVVQTGSDLRTYRVHHGKIVYLARASSFHYRGGT